MLIKKINKQEGKTKIAAFKTPAKAHKHKNTNHYAKKKQGKASAIIKKGILIFYTRKNRT